MHLGLGLGYAPRQRQVRQQRLDLCRIEIREGAYRHQDHGANPPDYHRNLSKRGLKYPHGPGDTKLYAKS